MVFPCKIRIKNIYSRLFSRLLWNRKLSNESTSRLFMIRSGIYRVAITDETRTSRSFKVSNWDILKFKGHFEIRIFIFLNTLNYGTLINKEIESLSNNSDILCWNSPRCCPRSSPDGWIRFFSTKLGDRYNRKIDITGRFTEKIRMIDL